MAGADPRLTFAICAFNEAANIGNLLETILSDPVTKAGEVLVVSSASTDGTDAIVAAFAAADPRVRLIREPERTGKVGAVNIVLRETHADSVVLIDADCLPAESALGAVVEPLDDPAVGGVGTRNLPVNAGESAVAGAAALMWELHHRVCLYSPVLGGDVVAFRRLDSEIPAEAGVNDDFLIEQALTRRGLRIVYAPDALTRMRVPTTAADFVRQRRRIHYGFIREHRAGGRAKGTQSARSGLRAALSLIAEQPTKILALGLLVLLDSTARLLAYGDVLFGRSGHGAWEPALSTKARIDGT